MARKLNRKFGSLYKHPINETLNGKQSKEEQCAFKSQLDCRDSEIVDAERLLKRDMGGRGGGR